MSRTAPTAPAAPCPLITDASHSTLPSSVSVEPVPALKIGLSSSTVTAATTASTAEPPAFRTACPARAAARQPATCAAPSGSVSSPSAPAPP